MMLEEIIAARIPAAVLERVVFDQNVIPAAEREALFKQTGIPFAEVARRVVEAYGNEASQLAYGFYEQVSSSDWKTAELLFEHFKSQNVDYYNHEASLVGRAPNLPLDEVGKFLEVVKGQV